MTQRLALGLLLVTASLAGADAPALTSALKAVELRAYSPRPVVPAFSGRTLDGRELSIQAHRGQVVVVNFWATWCLECRSEMPALERLHREFAPRGFSVIAVNARERHDVAERYARELGLSFPLVLDPDGRINALYGVIGLPTTFVVGRDGRAIALAIGPREWHGPPARTLVQALLDEPGPPTGAR